MFHIQMVAQGDINCSRDAISDIVGKIWKAIKSFRRNLQTNGRGFVTPADLFPLFYDRLYA